MFTMWPLCCARRIGSAARMTSSAPKKLASRLRAICSSLSSSRAPTRPYPALFTTTSIRPNAATACAIAAFTCEGSVTSSASARHVSGCRATRSSSCVGFRDVATRRCPRASTCVARARPKPPEQPVMSQTGGCGCSFIESRNYRRSSFCLALRTPRNRFASRTCRDYSFEHSMEPDHAKEREAEIELLKRIGQGDRGSFEELYNPALGKPLTWAVTLTRNKAIDRLRSTQRRNRLQDDVQRESEIFEQFDGQSSFDAVASVETSKLVREAIEELSKDQRQVIELAFFSSMTQTEIAERLNEPLGTIKARIRRAMMKLRDVISPQL